MVFLISAVFRKYNIFVTLLTFAKLDIWTLDVAGFTIPVPHLTSLLLPHLLQFVLGFKFDQLAVR